MIFDNGISSEEINFNLSKFYKTYNINEQNKRIIDISNLKISIEDEISNS